MVAKASEVKKRKTLTPEEQAKRKQEAAARFKKIATKRVNAAVKQMRLIGNCAGAGYAYTPEQIDKIRSTLQQGLDSALAKFDRQKKEELSIEL